MKRWIAVALWFAGLLLASDELRAVLQHAFFRAYVASRGSQWQFWIPSPEAATLAIYATVFFAAGAVLASRVSQWRVGLLLAIGLGVAIPSTTLFFEAPHPWMIQDHGNTWGTVALSWANWYLPPLASAAGAVAWSLAVAHRTAGQNVA
jgi:hypothetical protein